MFLGDAEARDPIFPGIINAQRKKFEINHHRSAINADFAFVFRA
jgi:hypothetical protein